MLARRVPSLAPAAERIQIHFNFNTISGIGADYDGVQGRLHLGNPPLSPPLIGQRLLLSSELSPVTQTNEANEPALAPDEAVLVSPFALPRH